MRSSSSLLRQLIFVLLALVAFAEFSFGQYQDRALERARSVKMLTDDREAVRKIFEDFSLDSSDETSDYFSFGQTQVEVSYSSGECDEAEREVWRVPAEKVVMVEIRDRGGWKRDDLKTSIASFEKEQMYAGAEDQMIYHSKRDGLAIEVVEDEIDRLVLFPSVVMKAKSCESKYAKEFISHKSWFGSKKLEDRFVCDLLNLHANVTGLELSHSEISAVTAKLVEVRTTAVDPENDILTFNYTVTGGRIIGAGAKVKWDLTGVRSGTYTITAGVDDGAGVIGQTKSMTVVVK